MRSKENSCRKEGGLSAGTCGGENSDGNCDAAVIEPFSPLEIVHSKPGKFRIMTYDGGNRGVIYPDRLQIPRMKGVKTEVRINKGLL